MGGRLLLVDDDPAVLDVLSEYFVGQGYKVSVASNGEAALSGVRVHRPDLVLLDIRMDGLDGVEVLRRLRRLDATLPVVMVTANEDVTLARETLTLGAFDYVAKPFDFSHLDTVVSAAVLHGGTTSEAASDESDAWTALATLVFQAVRGMAEAGRRSTGERMEAAVLEAARLRLAGRNDDARACLGELRLLLMLAGELGDLTAARREPIAAALAGLGVGAPPA
jgi:two-component system, response regulator, stage 0 sporulation protein F